MSPFLTVMCVVGAVRFVDGLLTNPRRCDHLDLILYTWLLCGAVPLIYSAIWFWRWFMWIYLPFALIGIREFVRLATTPPGNTVRQRWVQTWPCPYPLIAGLMVSPWIIYRSVIPKDAWQVGGQGFGRVGWEQVPALIAMITKNALHWYSNVGLPKWNFLWPILVTFVIISRSSRQYPWICLLWCTCCMPGPFASCCSPRKIPLRLGSWELAIERYTLIMLPPLWLVPAKTADEWWRIWRPPSRNTATAYPQGN